MERRSRIMLGVMAFMLIVISGVTLWTTVLRMDIMYNSASEISYTNAKVLNTITGELDLSVETSDELTLKSNNTNAESQVCSYNIIYSNDDFNKEFYVTINNEEYLVDSSNVILVEKTFTIDSNSEVEKSYTVTSNGNDGIITISNVECFVVE